MTCNDVARFLARRADAGDSLDPSTRTTLDAHLELCDSCRTLLESQAMVASILRARPADHPSPAFAARLAARLDEASGWFGIADWKAWTFRLVPVAAVLALAIYFGVESSSVVPATATVTVEEWATGPVETDAPVSLLWQPGVSPESLLETMLTGEMPASGGGAVNVR